MVRAFAAFLEFCYLVRRDAIDEDTLTAIQDALNRFHKERTIFEDVGIRANGFSLPRQHSLKHYYQAVRQFGAPNGLCSSITESKHIKAVKQPWRRSNRFNALGQMLTTNSRIDKLVAARVDFEARGLLDTPVTQAVNLHVQDMPDVQDDEDEVVEGAVEAEVVLARTPGESSNPLASLTHRILIPASVRNIPRDVVGLATYLNTPNLDSLLRRFLFEQLHPHGNPADVTIQDYPPITSKVHLFPSATATFFAPSDHSGMQGMRRERIRSVGSWRGNASRHDCAFLTKDEGLPGFKGLYVVRVHAFLSFKSGNTTYPCALVSWFLPIGDAPCSDTGMWMVRPDVDRRGINAMSVVHIDTMVRAAHLIGIAGGSHIPDGLKHTDSLDAFKAFYVNKYADHHAHTIAF